MEIKHEEFGKRLRRLVVAADMGGDSQRVMARRFGVNVSMYNAWLQGKTLPTMQRAVYMASILDCCVEFLLTGKGPPRADETVLVDMSLLEVEDIPLGLRQEIARDTESFCKKVMNSILDEAERHKATLNRLIEMGSASSKG